MASGTLRGLWERELRDLYVTEQKIIAALPELIAAANASELRTALERHLERTRIHVERLDLLFKQYGFGTASSEQSGIESVIRSGSERVSKDGAPEVRDAAIIAAAQHVEHYEMAGYGCARTWARQLGDDKAADLLQQTLDEEGDADKQLTRIAEAGINQDATAGAEFDSEMRSRLRYVDIDDLPARADYIRDATIRNSAGDDLGRLDGFILDASGRPYYIVVDSGGLFVGRRYVVPVGRTDFRRGDSVLTIDLDKDTLKRYPEFHSESFMAMSYEDSRRYEWRVLEAIDPQAARSSTREWDYERFPYYRRPEWFNDDFITPAERTTRSQPRGSRAREVPIVEQEERERVVAREKSLGVEERARDRERMRDVREDDEELP